MISEEQKKIVHVLVVENSSTVRDLLVDILNSDPEIRVVGTAADCEEAIKEVIEKKPDVITMDINLPDMDGLEATHKIMEMHPTPIVIVSGRDDAREVSTSFHAMEAGALAVLPRPKSIGHPEFETSAKELAHTVKQMSEVKVVQRMTQQRRDDTERLVDDTDVKDESRKFGIVGIGASTGGTIVLRTILSNLPKNFPIPILIVQHMPADFFHSFAEWLNEATELSVRVAVNGESLLPAHAYIAPDGFHMGVTKGNRIILRIRKSEHGMRPAVSYLFRSIAKAFEKNAIGILLTGTGKDGAEELKMMKEQGALTIAQDPQSSIVFGMPGEAIEQDGATYILSPEKISNLLQSLTGASMISKKSSAKNGIEILIVEDSPTQSEKLKNILEQNGYRVFAASNGVEALDALAKHNPMMIISDILMPEMDGFTLCDHIKKDERFKNIPVILLSALSDPKDVIHGLECGADNFIVQPYSDEYLLSRIDFIFANWRLHQNEKFQMGVEILLGGQKYYITSDRLQILNLLLSTFETVVNKNLELIKTRDELTALNEKLETLVQKRTTDLTTEREVSKYEEESVKKLLSAVDQTDEIIFMTETDGTINYINPAFEKIYGFTKDESIGKTPRILKSGVPDAAVYKKFWKAITTGKSVRSEIINKTKKGSLLTVESVVNPIFNENGIIIGYVAVQRVITEQKRSEKQFIPAIERAEDSERLKDAFMTNISHEIRTPLNTILGYTFLIEDIFKKNMIEEENNYFEGIYNGCERLIRTVDLILNVSRMESGDIVVYPKKIDFINFTEKIVSKYQLLAEKKTLSLTCKNECDQAVIVADEYTLTQAIGNLLDNAIKFTERGYVYVRLYRNADGIVCLDVQDTGTGISEKQMQNLFKRYSQERASYSLSYEGLGLGLSLVKDYLQLNNAIISVQSKKNVGTTFTIQFPPASADSTIAAQLTTDAESESSKVYAKKKAHHEKQKHNVLSVEDDLLTIDYMQTILKDYYTVFNAQTYEEAWVILNSQSIDIILMDISLPGNKNGLVLTKEIRKKKNLSDIPIIAVTAHAAPSDRDNCMKAGCSEYIQKPMSRTKLFEIMERLLAEREKKM